MDVESSSHLDENGQHVQLELYYEVWLGWRDLRDQLAARAGISPEEATHFMLLANERGTCDSMLKLLDGFNAMAGYFRQMTEVYTRLVEETREGQKIQREMLEIAKRQIRDADGEAPWASD